MTKQLEAFKEAIDNPELTDNAEKRKAYDAFMRKVKDVSVLQGKDESALTFVLEQRYWYGLADELALDLIKRGADVTRSYGADAPANVLDMAASNDYFEVIAELVRRGLAPLGEESSSRWFWVGNSVLQDQVAKVELLRACLAAGLGANDRSHRGRTMLMVCRHAACMKVLLDAGADVSAVDDKGQTALHHAAARGPGWADAPRMVDLLLAAGVDRSAKDADKQTAAQIAAKEGAWAVAAKIDPKYTAKMMELVQKKVLRGAELPKLLELLWERTLAGDTAILDALNELSLVAPDDALDVESLGVPKKLAKKLVWFAKEADGAVVGYYLHKPAELEQSVVMVDNEGTLRPYGQTLAEFIIMRADEVGAASVADTWLKANKVHPKRTAAQIAASAKTQPVPNL